MKALKLTVMATALSAVLTSGVATASDSDKKDPTPTPMKAVQVGKSYYTMDDLASFGRLLTEIQVLIDPKVASPDPGYVDPNPMEQIGAHFLGPIDPNLFGPKFEIGEVPQIEVRDICGDFFVQTWPGNAAAQQCACDWYESLADENPLRALATATLAGNRVAAGGVCYP